MKQPRPSKNALVQKRATRKLKRTAAQASGPPLMRAFVNPDLLAQNPSVGNPDFVQKGYYEDRPFRCRDCDKAEVWTATQQKWWYEIAKGDVWAVAVRCRPCRRLAQAQRAEGQRTYAEGMARRKKSNS